MTTPKQKLYKTAYSPNHHTYVALLRAEQDPETGEWFYHAALNPSTPDEVTIFDEDELTGYVL